jgi:hypothetical protein
MAAGGASQRWLSLVVVGIAPEPPQRDDVAGFFFFFCLGEKLPGGNEETICLMLINLQNFVVWC